ncbi:hypothetical protein [Flavobacterium olei]|uniref:hypothetical protein n=1 Tax=Flavobacterium olei TaxID=1886782 RepID=UPI003219C728
MEKISNRSLLLLSLGLFVIASSIIVPHLVIISDLSRGFIVGTGIGLLLLAHSSK